MQLQLWQQQYTLPQCRVSVLSWWMMKVPFCSSLQRQQLAKTKQNKTKINSKWNLTQDAYHKRQLLLSLFNPSIFSHTLLSTFKQHTLCFIHNSNLNHHVWPRYSLFISICNMFILLSFWNASTRVKFFILMIIIYFSVVGFFLFLQKVAKGLPNLRLWVPMKKQWRPCRLWSLDALVLMIATWGISSACYMITWR